MKEEEEEEGEVEDDDEVLDVLEGDPFESVKFSLVVDELVLKRFERLKKLPFPNMSPAFGWSAQ